MKYVTLFILLGGVGCSSTPTAETKDCIEYKQTTEVVERCVPLYGTLVCSTYERPRIWCVLYNED